MMHRFLFAALLLFICSPSSAQTEFRFADSTAVWNVMDQVFLEGPTGTWSHDYTRIYRVDGDSSFNNFNYQKITPGYDVAIAFLRKDSTGKVFRYDSATHADKLIYDFGLSEGDTITLNTAHEWRHWSDDDTLLTFVVDSVDTIQYGTSRKRMVLQRIPGNSGGWREEDTWIEGIGSVESHFIRPYTYEYQGAPGNGYDLLCFTEKGVTYNFSSNCYVGVEDILLDAHSLILSPNPATTQLRVELGDASSSLKTIQLYSVTGKEVLSLQASGQRAVLSTSQLAAGIYLCRVMLGDGSIAVRKVLIE